MIQKIKFQIHQNVISHRDYINGIIIAYSANYKYVSTKYAEPARITGMDKY